MAQISQQDVEPFTEKLFSRSSGAGGQNVNKVETKVQLRFSINDSQLDEPQKEKLLQSYPSGFVLVDCEETRSRARNMDIAFERLLQKLNGVFVVQKPRKQTKAPYRTKLGKFKKMLKDKLGKYKRRNIDV